MENKGNEVSVGLLEPPTPVEALPPTPSVQTFPVSLENIPVAPESADSASIVSKLHEFDAKRVGDDRKVRHERARYINELIKTQSSDILIDAASHFMSVGDDGKIKESSSLKSLRDRLVKEKGIELTAQGMDKDSVVKEQVALYKGILTTAAETLPDEQRIRYQSKRLTPNVAAKRRTLEGRNKSKRVEASVAPTSSGNPIVTESLSRRMVLEAQESRIDAAEAALDRAKNPLPSDNPDAYFTAVGEHAAKIQPQSVEAAAFERGRQNEGDRINRETDELIKAEGIRNQARTDAADEAVASREALKSQGTYVEPGDPEDIAGQERVKDFRMQEQDARQEALRQADAEEAQSAFEKERADQKAKFDAVKVETSVGYTNAPEKPDFSNTPLPSEQTNEFFASIGKKAEEAAHEQEKGDAILTRIRQEHADRDQVEAEKAADPLKDVRERAERAAAAGRPINYQDRIDLRTGTISERTQSAITAMVEEKMKQRENQINSTTTKGRVKRFGSSLLRTAIIAGMIYTPLKSGEMIYDEYHQPTPSTHTTEINLDSSQMSSEQALANSGVQIDSSNIKSESPRGMADSNVPKSHEGEVHSSTPQVKGIGAKLRGFFGGNKNG